MVYLATFSGKNMSVWNKLRIQTSWEKNAIMYNYNTHQLKNGTTKSDNTIKECFSFARWAAAKLHYLLLGAI